MAVDMPKKNRYVTEEFLEHRLDERFAEQAELIQQGFFGVQGQFADADIRFSGIHGQLVGLHNRIDRLEEKIENGFGKLDAFLGKINCLDEAEVMNQAAHRRYDDRLTSLEQKPART